MPITIYQNKSLNLVEGLDLTGLLTPEQAAKWTLAVRKAGYLDASPKIGVYLSSYLGHLRSEIMKHENGSRVWTVVKYNDSVRLYERNKSNTLHNLERYSDTVEAMADVLEIFKIIRAVAEQVLPESMKGPA
jgi:hypothetical protein